MNYKELKRAGELYEEINKINDFLNRLKTYNTNIKISTNFQKFYSLKCRQTEKI